MTDSNQFIVGRRVVDDSVPMHWQTVDLDTYSHSKPIVLILGGTGADDNKIANGYAKIINSLLGVFKDETDVLSVNYNQGIYTPTLAQENAKMLVKKLLLPQISLNGAKIDTNLACRNVRQFTVFAHCNGDKIFNMMVQELENELNALGYTEAETLKLISQLFLVSYGTMSTHWAVKIMNVISPFDEVFRSGKQVWRSLLSKLDEVKINSEDKEFFREMNLATDPSIALKKFYSHNERCYVLRNENEIHLATSQLHTGGDNEHSIGEFFRDMNWNHHKNMTMAGDAVSRCLAAALCNAVANSIMNRSSSSLIEFDIEYLQTQLEEIVQKLNKYDPLIEEAIQKLKEIQPQGPLF